MSWVCLKGLIIIDTADVRQAVRTTNNPTDEKNPNWVLSMKKKKKELLKANATRFIYYN